MFILGNNFAQVDEAPEHEVCVDDFYLDKYEVTQARWEKVMGFNPSKFPAPDKPVEQITFYDVQEFAEESKGLCRIPTEAEWEYACRAGTQGAYSFTKDDLFLDDIAWYKGNSDDHYHKSGLKKPNGFSLFDMHGNVAEWVLDHYNPDGYSSNLTFTRGTKLYPKVVRGGSFKDVPERLRSAARGFSEKAWKKQDPQSPKSLWWHTDAPHIGFRIVRPKIRTFQRSNGKILDQAHKGILSYEEKSQNQPD